MLRLDVPFIPDQDYPDFLADHAESLASVHFSLHDRSLADARQRMSSHSMDAVIAGLTQLGSVPKYALMNSRLHAPDAYRDPARLDATARSLSRLRETVGLDGIIFADPYYLQALSDAHPDIAAQLEGVPSVNTMLDSAEKTFAMLDMIGETAFMPPTRIVADRSLNRDLTRLGRMRTSLSTTCPDLKIHLMANEGCLYQCPYKPAHDAHVAMIVEGLCGDRTFAMNRDFGCVRRLLSAPAAMLASPFIRPEDAASYASHAEAIKLCGRTKGAKFLKRAITAYLDGQYTGNLLDLMDAMGDLSDRVNIPNHRLPDTFFDRVTTCEKQCRTCGWCADIAKAVITRTDPGLPKL